MNFRIGHNNIYKLKNRTKNNLVWNFRMKG